MMYREGAPPPADTVRCLYCAREYLPTGGYCACGAQLPTAVPDATFGPFACPRCTGESLVERPKDARVLLRQCQTCSGIFVGPRSWTELISTASTIDVSSVDVDPSTLSHARLLPMSACPVCRVQMDRANFAARSGIQVDVCNVHGIWLDAGELYEIVLWLEAGCPELPAGPPTVFDLQRATAVSGVKNGNDVYDYLVRAGHLMKLRT